MKSSRASLVLAVVLAAAVGCGKDEKAGSSATEIFALRSQCADLAKKLLAGGVHGANVQARQKSNYNAENNRCYVELDFSPADSRSADYQATRYLYDGQTGEMLAWYRVDRSGDGAENTACSITDNANLWVPDRTACDDVNAKITEVMADKSG
jgi:hypothetical protein